MERIVFNMNESAVQISGYILMGFLLIFGL